MKPLTTAVCLRTGLGVALTAVTFSTAAAPLVVAGLPSFFHGTPAQQPKAPPPKQVAVVSTAAGLVPDAEVEGFLRGFADALKARDGKPLLPRLAAKYSIDGVPADRKAPDFFLQAVERYPSPAEMVIQSVEKRGEVREVTVLFRYSVDSIKAKKLRFDAEGKLLWSDLFLLKRHGSGS